MVQRREVKTPYISLLISLSPGDSSDHVKTEGEQESNYSLNPFPVPGWTHYYNSYYKTISMDPEHSSLGGQLADEEEIEQSPGVTRLNFSVQHFLNYRTVMNPEYSSLSEQLADEEEIEQFYVLSPPLNLPILPFEMVTAELYNPILNELFATATEMERGTMASFRTFELKDTVFEETYTAHMEKEATGWRGWIPDVPEVEYCTAQTENELLKALTEELQYAIEVEKEEWKRHFKAAVKAGKLEPLREEALEDVRAGRFTYL